MRECVRRKRDFQRTSTENGRKKETERKKTREREKEKKNEIM